MTERKAEYKEIITIVVVFFAAFCVRMVYLEQIKSNPFFMPRSLDPWFYHAWATDIISGNWLGKSVFQGMPLYAYFLAGIYAVAGVSVYAAYFVQVVIGALSCVLIFLLGRRVFSYSTGVIAAIGAILYKPFIFYDGMLVGASLVVLLYLVVLLFFINYIDRPSTVRGVLLGILIGIAGLARAPIVLLPLFYFGYLAFKSLLFPSAINLVVHLKRCAVLFIGICIVFSITTLRNYFVAGDMIALTAHSGFNMYIGNNPDATGRFHAPQGIGRQIEYMMDNAHAIAEKQLGRELKPSEGSRFWKQRAYGWIRKNPFDFIKLLCRKIYLFWQGGEISDFRNIEFFERFSALMRLPFITFMMIVPLAVIGIVLSLKRNGCLTVLRCFIVSYLVAIIMYFINSRYRIPVVPVLLIFAAHTVTTVIQQVAARRYKRFFCYIIVICTVYFLFSLKYEKPNLSDDYNELGSWYISEKHDYKKGIALFKEAVRLKPDNDFVWFNLACAYFDENDLDYARAAFEKCIELNSNDYESYNLLGIICAKENNHAEAASYFKQAIDSNSRYYKAYNNLATTYRILDEPEAARQLWRQSLEIKPDQLDIRQKLSE